MADILDLDALSGLEDAATLGPWHVRLLDDDHAMRAVGIAAEPDAGADRRWRENAEPIVAMRNALPVPIRLARCGYAAARAEASTSA